MSAAADFKLTEVSFEELQGWRDDDPSALFASMGDILAHLEGSKPYRTGALGLTADDLRQLLEKSKAAKVESAEQAREFFEINCVPFRIALPEEKRGFVTAFYEPELEVSAAQDDIWKHPIYNRPADLIDIDESNRPADMDPYYAFGLAKKDGKISAYPDRQAIDQGYLDGRGLEIAWAKSKVDLFFVHVQGAARLRYPDGSLKRITYAAKAGHRFSPIGRLLLDRGEIDPATVSMQTIRQWLTDHPDQVDDVLWHNRSYIFFREAEVDLELGPIAAAKVPLIAGRSLAVDRLIHTFGFPFFISASTLTHLDDGQPFGRLMLALDTGSAIVGPARGDIFTGSGYEAGELAGTVRNQADFTILIPREAAERYR